MIIYMTNITSGIKCDEETHSAAKNRKGGREGFRCRLLDSHKETYEEGNRKLEIAPASHYFILFYFLLAFGHSVSVRKYL